jgi:tyrosyl-tRNA synthetase
MQPLDRGVEEIIIKEHLETALKSGRKLRVKFGIDPTSPDLHLGHAVVLRKLRQFQNLGHKIVLIIGDFTAQIGDPSGRNKSRPPLTEREIKKNLKTYLSETGKILDIKKTETHHNSAWLKKLGTKEIIGLMADFTIQQIIEREDFSSRIKNQKPVWMHENIYSLLQIGRAHV